MAGVTVPAFAVVLPDQLPVGPYLVVDHVSHARPVKALGRQCRCEIARAVVDRGGIGAEPDEHQSSDLGDRRAVQPIRVAVDVGLFPAASQ